jgi:hypothetical protein
MRSDYALFPPDRRVYVVSRFPHCTDNDDIHGEFVSSFAQSVDLLFVKKKLGHMQLE